jgi:hypothetical protein
MWHRLLHYCGREESLTVFLWLLVLLIFVVAPLSHKGRVFEPIVSSFFGIVLVTGILATLASPILALIAACFVSIVFAIALLKAFNAASITLICVSETSALAAFGLFLYMMFRQTMKAGPVTSHRLKGGIAVYLLIGMFWARLFHLIALTQAGAFVGVDSTSPFYTFVYFSFVTLTTLGYGDVTPLSDFARSMATAEALLGQLFPAIFIARLVTLRTNFNRPTRNDVGNHTPES